MTAAPPLTQRSRATNGKSLFADGGDMRGPWARRLRDLIWLHTADLDGADGITEAERSLIRRAGVLTVELERLEARFSVSEPTPYDLDVYQRAAGNLRRLLEAAGIQYRARGLTPGHTNLTRGIDGRR